MEVLFINYVGKDIFQYLLLFKQGGDSQDLFDAVHCFFPLRMHSSFMNPANNYLFLHNTKSHRGFRLAFEGEFDKVLGQNFLSDMDPSYSEVQGKDPNDFSMFFQKIIKEIHKGYISTFFLKSFFVI